MKKIIFYASLFLLTPLFFNVSAQSPEPDPIVIVPGILASWNTDVFFENTSVQTPWQFFPGVKNYDNLINALEEKGYVLNQNLFIAYYDWRQSNLNSATDYLIPVIDQALQNAPNGKVDIIAHSMGGLVARAYIQDYGYRNDVDQFFMLGTPNYGSSDAYEIWEGGNVPGHWNTTQKSELSFVLWLVKELTDQTNDRYDVVHAYIPSIKELLPEYDYLVDNDTQTVKPTSDLNQTNPVLGYLNSETGLNNLWGNVREINMIAGSGENTVNTIPVIDRGAEPKLWVDGKPEPINPAPNSTDGDNTVLSLSTFLEEPYNPTPVRNDLDPLRKFFSFFLTPVYAQTSAIASYQNISSTHEELPTGSIDQILASFGQTAYTGVILPPYEPDAITSFWFASPVDVKIIDPEGYEITKDANEVPDSFYEGTSNPLGPKFIIIHNPKNGDYKVELTGIGDGEYHMGVTTVSDNADNTSVVEGNIQTGQGIGYTVSYNSTTPESPVEISEPEPIGEPELSAIDIAQSLVSDVETYYSQGLIKGILVKKTLSGSFQLLVKELTELESLKEKFGTTPSTLLERKINFLTQIIKAHIKGTKSLLEFYSKKNIVDPVAASAMTAKLNLILEKL